MDLGDGLAVSLLSRLLGADADLDLVGWNGLANTSLTLRQLGVQLGAGSVDELLDTELTVGQLATAIATVLSNAQADPDADVQATLADIAALDSETTLPTIPLGDVLLVDPASGSSALDTAVDASSLLMALGQRAILVASLANGDNFATIDLDVPGLTSVQVALIGPPRSPWVAPARTVTATGSPRPRPRRRASTSSSPCGAAAATVAGAGSTSATMFRDEIDALSSCTDALAAGSSAPGSLRSRIKGSIDAYEQAAGLLGVTVSPAHGPGGRDAEQSRHPARDPGVHGRAVHDVARRSRMTCTTWWTSTTHWSARWPGPSRTAPRRCSRTRRS